MDLLDCTACPRLATWLGECRRAHPGFHARPVPAWGDPAAPILILGLAPGFRGANRTGRPFWGDASGAFLCAALAAVGLLRGEVLHGARISNVVKCAPPENRPTAAEIRTCRQWLRPEVARARVVVALGRVAHAAVCAGPFAHGSEHRVGDLVVLDAFHPSPLNTRTGRLDAAMLEDVLRRATER